MNKIWNSISHLELNITALENANARDFNDMIKFDLLKSKLKRKDIPVSNNDLYIVGNPLINSPAILQV